MYTIEQIKENMHSIDRQLLYMIYEQQTETNRLLRLLTNENKQEDDPLPSDEHINAATDDIDSLKRPELMKRIAKLSNKPQGWNKWETEDMRKHLKGAS